MIKIFAAVILIAAVLMSGHRWRMPSTTTGRATVSPPSTLPNGVTTGWSLRERSTSVVVQTAQSNNW
jgi:transposase